MLLGKLGPLGSIFVQTMDWKIGFYWWYLSIDYRTGGISKKYWENRRNIDDIWNQ